EYTTLQNFTWTLTCRYNKHWCKCITLPPHRSKLDFEVLCSQKKSHLGLQSFLTIARGCMMRF
ncbi:unnamed protein product, partial [Brassica rapa]